MAYKRNNFEQCLRAPLFFNKLYDKEDYLKKIQNDSKDCIKLLFIYSPLCDACKITMPEFEEIFKPLVRKYNCQNPKKIELFLVDGSRTEIQDILNLYNVKYFPSFIAIFPGEQKKFKMKQGKAEDWNVMIEWCSKP